MSNPFPAAYKAATLGAIESIDLEKVGRVIEIFRQARDEGRGIFICGNGGSAATASHFATEIVKGASYGKAKRFRMMALTDSMSTLTAYSNDVSYDCAFAEQLKNFAEPGDVVLGLSSSGNSPSVLRAIEYANALGCRTIAFTGFDGGKLGPLAELNLHIPVPHTGRSEEAHMVVMHMICYYFMEEEQRA